MMQLEAQIKLLLHILVIASLQISFWISVR